MLCSHLPWSCLVSGLATSMRRLPIRWQGILITEMKAEGTQGLEHPHSTAKFLTFLTAVVQLSYGSFCSPASWSPAGSWSQGGSSSICHFWDSKNEIVCMFLRLRQEAGTNSEREKVGGATISTPCPAQHPYYLLKGSCGTQQCPHHPGRYLSGSVSAILLLP